jgi:cystathionine gamma-lyase
MHSAVKSNRSAILESHPRVERVYYPGLASHPQHELATRQMNGFGGMITIHLDSDLAGTRRFLERTKLFSLAESLGGVESLIELPARMTHASTADAPFAAPLNLIRLSVGLESPEDLLEDLERALTPVGTRSARSV